MFTGKVVSQPDPKQILVSVDNVPTGDCLLKFDDNIKGDIPAGTEIQFKGVVDSYTARSLCSDLEHPGPENRHHRFA